MYHITFLNCTRALCPVRCDKRYHPIRHAPECYFIWQKLAKPTLRLDSSYICMKTMICNYTPIPLIGNPSLKWRNKYTMIFFIADGVFWRVKQRTRNETTYGLPWTSCMEISGIYTPAPYSSECICLIFGSVINSRHGVKKTVGHTFGVDEWCLCIWRSVKHSICNYLIVIVLICDPVWFV